MTKIIIDKDFIKSLNPCKSAYQNAIKLYPNFKGTWYDVMMLEHIPSKDKIWLFIQEIDYLELRQHEFACFNAELVLDNYERLYPNDDRPRKAIEAKRKWVRGEITDKELDEARSAARSAAELAARSAWSAAESAAWSAAELAAELAELAAWSAELAELAESAAWLAELAELATWSDIHDIQVSYIITLVQDL